MPRKHSQSNKTRKRKNKDLDQILEDMLPEKAAKLMNQEVDVEIAGDAQFYCIECKKHFITEEVRKLHYKGKLHKQQLRRLQEMPYTQKEADAAAGLGIFPVIKNRRDEK